MPNPIEILEAIGAEPLDSLATAYYGGTAVKNTFGDKEQKDPAYVVHPSQLEALRKHFITQYLKEQQAQSSVNSTLPPLSSAVQDYINSANS